MDTSAPFPAPPASGPVPGSGSPNAVPVRPGDPPPTWGQPREPGSGGRTADIIVTIVLILGGIIEIASLAFFSLFLVMMSDSCGSTTNPCDTSLMNTGWLIALIGPAVVFVPAVVWAIVRLVRRKLAWWVVLAGGALAFGVFCAGAAIMTAGLGD